MTQPYDALVVGAGMTGLAAADRLSAEGYRVCVLEAESTIGGLARAIETQGDPIDAYYHHVFPQDREILQLVERFGLADRFEWRKASTGVLSGGRLYPFDSVLDLLRFRPLSPWGRLRLGMGGAGAFVFGRRRSVANARVGESGPRWFGRAGYRILWKPLLDGKFGEYAADVSMAWLAARMRQRALARKSGRGDRLGYLRGGYGVLADRLGADLRQRGVTVETGAPVSRLERDGESWRVDSRLGELVASAVVACVPGPTLAGLVDLPPDYAKAVRAIPFRGVVCALLELDRPLGRYYWINLAEPSPLSCLAVIEHTNYVPAEWYGGRHLVYLTHYVDVEGPVWRAGVEEVVNALSDVLRTINPAFEPDWILASHVSRDPWAQPVPLAGGPMPDLPLSTGLPGLFNASLAHIYPDDRGMSLALQLGARAAGATAEWLASGSPPAGGR